MSTQRIPSIVYDMDRLKKEVTEGLPYMSDFCPDMVKSVYSTVSDCDNCILKFYCMSGVAHDKQSLIDYVVDNEYITKAQGLELLLEMGK